MPAPVGPDFWEVREVRRALATHDITTLYRSLNAAGVTQREIAHLTGQGQSDVSEILSGDRRVMSYDVLERIADGLGVPRGYMGLAYDEGRLVPPDEDEEVDEDMKRRALLAAGGLVVFGAPVFGTPDPSALTFRDVISHPPSHIGMQDVATYEQVVVRLERLDRESGGIAARKGLAAVGRCRPTIECGAAWISGIRVSDDGSP
ncbi:MAG: helix-turn-helix domain-containing protein [Pseudonocardiaceae bacterium]